MPKKTRSQTKPEIKSSAKLERIPSGIPGLDKLIEGGFWKGSTNLISGGAGVGKSIFCIQFLIEGLKRGEICMFITLEQKPEDIIGDVARFGWDLEKYIKDKKLFLVYQDPFQLMDVTAPILDEIKEHRVSRVAVDSTGVFGMYYKDPFEIRKQLFKLLAGLKSIGVTSVLTSELTEDSKILSRFGVEEFIVDGLFTIRYNEYASGATPPLSLNVRKMRRTAHSRMSIPMEITSKGIVLKSK